MKKTFWLIAITILVLFSTSACAGYVPTPPPGVITSDLTMIYTPGQYIRMPDRGVGIQSVDYTEDGVVVTVVLENLSENEMPVRPAGTFSAKNSDDTSLDPLWWGCAPALNGKLLPNERLVGKLCWKEAEPGMTIYYAPYWGANAIAQFQLPTEANATVGTQVTGSVAKIYSIGETVAIGNQEIMVTSVDVSSNHTRFHLAVRNTSNEKVVYISAPADFYAKKTDGTKVSITYDNCGKSLEGYLLPGDMLQGELCYPSGEPLRLTYNSAAAIDSLVGWEINGSQNVDLPPWSRNLSWDIYGPDTTVEVGLGNNQQTVRMEQYTLSDGSLQATIAITNTSETSMSISSLLNFGARNPDGTNLDYNILCGGTLDGEIPAGQTLRGKVCFNDAQSGATIYYLYDVFGPGIVVWEIQ